MIRHNGVCECGAKIVAWKRWRQLTTEHRATLRAMGYARSITSTECQPCYARRRYREKRAAAGGSTRVPRSGLGGADLVAELDHLNPAWRNLPVRSVCREVAPQLGMRWETLERALYRHGVRSRYGFDRRMRQVAA